MRFLKNIILAITLFILASTVGWAQYATPVTFWLSPQLTAPTAMATQYQAQISAHYQKQGLAGTLGSRSMILSGQFPLAAGSRIPLGTIGLNVIRQESGASYLMATTGAMLTYNYTVNLSSQHHLIGGLQGGYFSRGIDWTKVRTSNQYGEGQLNPDLGHGESFSDYKSSAFTTNVGLGYFLTDARGDQIFHIGGGLINANRARFTYLENDDNQAEPHRWTAYSQLRLIRTPFYELSTKAYWQQENRINDFVGGLQLTKGINNRKSLTEEHLGLGLYYSPDQSATLAMQFLRNNLLLGVSYSLPFGNKNIRGLQNAAEVTVGWRLPGSGTTARSNYSSGYKRQAPDYKSSQRLADKRAKKAYRRKMNRRSGEAFQRPSAGKPSIFGNRKFSKKVSSYKYKANKRSSFKRKKNKSRTTMSRKYRKSIRQSYKFRKANNTGRRGGFLRRLFGAGN